MISQQGCPLWFEVVEDLSCWWAGYHEVTAVEKMQSSKQDMPLWTLAAISHGLFQFFVSSRGAEAFVRDGSCGQHSVSETPGICQENEARALYGTLFFSALHSALDSHIPTVPAALNYKWGCLCASCPAPCAEGGMCTSCSVSSVLCLDQNCLHA